MARLTIYRDNDTDSTSVSNLFIDEYMGAANDAQLKIYLYLLRMMNAHLATSVSDIADKFNHTEKDVVRALKYWEKLHLLELDYDATKTLVGIHMHDLSNSGAPKQTPASNNMTFIPVPTVQLAAQSLIQPVGQTMVQPMVQPMPQSMMQPTGQTMEQNDTLEVPAYQKPVYTAEQLRQFKDREDTAQLLFIAESYIGKPLTPSEIKTILFFTDVLHFSDDMIDYLIQYCVDKGKKDFKYIEKVAINWAEEGISTPKQAQQKTYLYDKNVYLIMRELGKNSTPTTREASYITRWIQDYGFDTDVIFEACARAVMATDKNRIEYTDKILASWHQQNVHHKSDISKIDEMYKQRRKNGASSGAASGASAGTSKAGGNRFNSFSQNSYDFDALEQELLSNQ